MATDSLPSAAGGVQPAEVLIDRQLLRTRRQLKVVELVAVGLHLLLLWSGLFFLLIVVDHWIMPLSSAGRWGAWLLLCAASIWHLVARVWPIVRSRVNTVYAAKLIEDAQPSLKNSLLNFLLLRQPRAGMSEFVLDNLRQRAARDLSQVPGDHVVDQTPLIQLGYILCGVMIVLAIYKFVSPKDPFASVARVVLPWSDVAQPSRVRIVRVEPGDAAIFQGQTLSVAVDVEGVRSSDRVVLRYSTLDEQHVDVEVTLAHKAGHRYTVSLPTEGTAGLQQSLRYRVMAGDAVSSEYRVTVSPAPRVDVERVELEYPAYTQRPSETLRKQGDIKAIEGTKVKLVAVSNLPLSTAYIRFNPENVAAANQRGRDQRESLAMQVTDREAVGAFQLKRRERAEATWQSYRVEGLTTSGLRNEQPTLHRIEILADVPPEVEMLRPERRRVEVPLNGELEIEVKGRDPDFGLTQLSLEFSRQNTALHTESLFTSAGQRGPVIKKYLFRPAQFKVAVGDEIQFVAIARDNRHDALGKPAANEQRTDRYVVKILPPESNAGDNEQGKTDPRASSQQPNNKNASDPATRAKPDSKTPEKNSSNKQTPSDQPENKSNNDRSGEKEKSEKNSAGNKKPSNESGKNAEQGSKSGAKNSSPNKPEQSPDNASGNEKQPPSDDNPQKEQNSGGDGGGASDKQQGGSQSSSGGASGNQQSGGGESGEPDDKNSSSGEQGGSQSSSNSGGDNQQSSSNKNSSGGNSASKKAGSSQSPSGGEQNGADQSGDSPRAGQGGAAGNEQRSRPLNDGEVIEETLKRMKEQGQDPLSKGQPSSSQDNPTNSAGQPSSSQQGASSNATKAADKQPGQGDQNSGQADQAGKSADNKQGNAGESASNQPQPKTGDANSPQSAGNKPTGGAAEKSPGKKNDDAGGPSSAQPANAPQPSSKQGDSQGGPQNSADKPASQSGSGQKPREDQGSGDAQGKNNDTKKSSDAGGADNSNSSEKSPSQSNKQSSTKGGESGDQSGAGKQGGGQGAKQPGRDQAGSQQASDAGAGAAQEAGQGEKSNAGGRDQQSPEKTGQTGTKPGEKGSGKAAGGDKISPQPGGQSARHGANSSDPVSGGGAPGEGFAEGSGKREEIPLTEAENLEFAKRATDLALQHLKDQRDKPDPDLLKRLGWSRDDLDAFLRRWDDLKRSAKEDPAASPELDDAYRSLGLRPGADRSRAAGNRNDTQRSLRDSGARSEPPSNYAEQFRAFRKGVSRSAVKE